MGKVKILILGDAFRDLNLHRIKQIAISKGIECVDATDYVPELSEQIEDIVEIEFNPTSMQKFDDKIFKPNFKRGSKYHGYKKY